MMTTGSDLNNLKLKKNNNMKGRTFVRKVNYYDQKNNY